MKSLDEIKADKTYKLTKLQNRLFMFAGCDPTCHACGENISVGDDFKLVAHNLTDEMCCGKCDKKSLEKRDRNRRRRENRANAAWTGGYSRPSAPAASGEE